MIPIIAPLLADFYFLLCEVSCKTPSALCFTIKDVCADYIILYYIQYVSIFFLSGYMNETQKLSSTDKQAHSFRRR